jgi:hypothetical protein
MEAVQLQKFLVFKQFNYISAVYLKKNLDEKWTLSVAFYKYEIRFKLQRV